jgi:TnpA family transposase
MKFPDKWRFRVNFFGKVVLQRAHRVPGLFPGDWVVRWEDAVSTDISQFFREAATCNSSPCAHATNTPS